ncbi:MAG: succinate dehydrogenase, cytochrome b556 subunit [Burkholderiaceae bacterium]|nr:succinate dehydrogenase, cytochrome b556 subunit [Burkholderiaceae bacterium]
MNDIERARTRRPVFLNLYRIQMPVGAFTSIMHRITGVLLALGIPLSVYLLDRSLQGPQAYAEVTGWFDNLAFRIAAIASVWALAHHLLAGIRHMLSDIDIGSQLPAARRSAWMVNLTGLVVALLAAGALL